MSIVAGATPEMVITTAGVATHFRAGADQETDDLVALLSEVAGEEVVIGAAQQ